MDLNKITSKIKKGTIIVEVEGFFIERFLNLCKLQKIEIYDVEYKTVGLISFKTDSNNFTHLKTIANKTKCKIKIKKKKGIYFVLFRYKKRKMFFFLFLLVAIALVTLSTFIFKIDIKGNENVTDKEILQVLKKAGVYVGKNRLLIDERKAGNMLRTEIYDIAWVGVEVKGTKVNVEVVEKTLEEKDEYKDMPGNIVATKSGIVTKIIAENGTARLYTGSYIEKGMIAIEGVIESEFIGNVNVHASGILRVKNTYTYEAEEKYSVDEKEYTGKKRYGIGISINNKEYLVKCLPKKHIYDINKTEKSLAFTKGFVKFVFAKYTEYDLVKKDRSYEELCDIAKKKYNSYIDSTKSENSVVSNEKVEIQKTEDGIKYIVTYDLEEDAGVFQKTGE